VLISYDLERREHANVLRLTGDETNRLTRERVESLTSVLVQLGEENPLVPLIITGNQTFFSAGADLKEIARLASDAFDFAQMGQRLMRLIDEFPAAVCAAIYGYCMGGGLDLALACDMRIAHPDAIFGHRGAALGLITGWGGTQRLPRLVGKAKALEMFVAAEKLNARQAFQAGLLNEVCDDPVARAVELLRR
jgi:enoyl-CoA hydratase/carnithine racemase